MLAVEVLVHHRLLMLMLWGCQGTLPAADVKTTTDTQSGPGETGDSGTSTGWDETDWCEPLGDLSAVSSAYTPSNLRQSLLDLSAVRYPPATGFIDAQSDSDLAAWFYMGTDTFDDVLDAYEVAVHEGSHIWGFGYWTGSSYSYRVIDDSYIIETAYLDNFPRSEILGRHPYADTDFYADTYLTGASGDQGFNTVLDEFNAYTHSIASRYCTRDSVEGATSARDGVLTFMFYVELYLQTAREDHPDDYEEILDDPQHVRVILAIWDRAEFWLDKSADEPSLGIDDDAIAAYVYDPVYLDEIDRLR